MSELQPSVPPEASRDTFANDLRRQKPVVPHCDDWEDFVELRHPFDAPGGSLSQSDAAHHSYGEGDQPYWDNRAPTAQKWWGGISLTDLYG